MDTLPSPTVVAAFATVTMADATRPLVTFYDDATGERTELSAATLANWVAKTANLLIDGCGLGAGDVAAVALPPHWQTACVLLGCWSAGLVIDMNGASTQRAAVAFVTADRVNQAGADETYALALAPMAAPFRPSPPVGALDYAREVRAHGDHFAPHAVGTSTAALADGTTHAQLVAAAVALGVPTAERVLIDADAVIDPVGWLVAPLLAGASVVLCRHLDPTLVARRLREERATAYP